MRHFVFLICAALLAWLPQAASAQVSIAFYSHELGTTFPHAFFTVKGRLQRGGPEIDTNIGYTAKSLDAAILMGSVPGYIQVAKPKYIANSRRHFSVVVSDATYDRLIALAADWGARPKGYNLGRSNCVHFIGEAAQVVGLKVNFEKRLMKKPRSFLEAVVRDNTAWFAARQVAPGS